MGQPAVVEGDRIQGTCQIHLGSSPDGNPIPAGPLPFSAPLNQGMATTVTIERKAAAVVGSSGLNKPPHAGLHASDPYLTSTTQVGRVITGSTSVTFDGRPAAHGNCGVSICGQAPGGLTGTATTVTIGP